MKLKRQTSAKGVIVAVTAGLLIGFLALIRSEPRIKAAPEPEGATVDYQRFFSPAGGGNAPTEPVRVHTRTRAS